MCTPYIQLVDMTRFRPCMCMHVIEIERSLRTTHVLPWPCVPWTPTNQFTHQGSLCFFDQPVGGAIGR